MSITTKMVSELRDKTNATMDVCKRALVRTNGDISAAEEEIRVNYKNLVGNSEVEQLRQRVAELEKERDEEIARNRPLRNLIASLEEQKLHWNKQRDEYREAVSTMDSERSANATLTAERDELLSDVERCYRMLLSEPDTQGALFKAENILREAIASVKEK